MAIDELEGAVESIFVVASKCDDLLFSFLEPISGVKNPRKVQTLCAENRLAAPNLLRAELEHDVGVVSRVRRSVRHVSQ